MLPINQDTVLIRDATLADRFFLKDMIWQALLASPALLQHLGGKAIEEEQKLYWQTWNPSTAPAFIAYLNQTQRKLGAILLRHYEVNNLIKWRIGMAVETSARGQGIGKLLLKRAIEFANASDIKLITLFVDPLNEPALKLYRGCGFLEVATVGSLIQMDHSSCS